jgi:hypothetical protein
MGQNGRGGRMEEKAERAGGCLKIATEIVMRLGDSVGLRVL